MKLPDEIKKGLELCQHTSYNGCCRCHEGCPYRFTDRCDHLRRDALAYIQQLESREWDLFDLLSSAWHGKQYYSKQEDGSVYSRESCQYLTFDQAIDEFAHSLTVARDINVPTNQPNVVRCGKCVHGSRSPWGHPTLIWCPLRDSHRDPNWFCADGKRRDK